MRRAVELAGDRVEHGFLQRTAVVPASHMRRQGPHRVMVECIPETQPVEDARGVRPHIDAAAHLVELGRLLIDIDVEPSAMQRQPSGKPAKAATDHRNFAYFAAHHRGVKLRGALVSTASTGESDAGVSNSSDDRAEFTIGLSGDGGLTAAKTAGA